MRGVRPLGSLRTAGVTMATVPAAIPTLTLRFVTLATKAIRSRGRLTTALGETTDNGLFATRTVGVCAGRVWR